MEAHIGLLGEVQSQRVLLSRARFRWKGVGGGGGGRGSGGVMTGPSHSVKFSSRNTFLVGEPRKRTRTYEQSERVEALINSLKHALKTSAPLKKKYSIIT